MEIPLLWLSISLLNKILIFMNFYASTSDQKLSKIINYQSLVKLQIERLQTKREDKNIFYDWSKILKIIMTIFFFFFFFFLMPLLEFYYLRKILLPKTIAFEFLLAHQIQVLWNQFLWVQKFELLRQTLIQDLS